MFIVKPTIVDEDEEANWEGQISAIKGHINQSKNKVIEEVESRIQRSERRIIQETDLNLKKSLEAIEQRQSSMTHLTRQIMD